MRIKFILVKVILPLLVVAGGVAGMRIMALSKTPPVKEAPRVTGTLVETLTVRSTPWSVTVRATGTVRPRRETVIAPQVSGRVVHISSNLVAGGFFRKGDLLFTVDKADYELSVEKSRAEVAKAEYNLAQVRSRARVARKEWDRIRLEKKERPNPLVLHEPQLKDARASLASAKADLARRLLDIERTRIHAPFNCRVRKKEIGLGQYVGVGTAAAVVTGTDVAEIVVPVPLHELGWLDIPRGNRRKGSAALVSVGLNGASVTWKGRIDRSMGEVDPKGRMARLVIAVKDPYALSAETEKRAVDLAEGLFVDVAMTGRVVEGIIPLPSSVLRDGGNVWLMTAENHLDIRKVTVLRKERDNALIASGIGEGDRIVTTHISGASRGMKLRRPKEDKT